eukprot:1515281-Pyramimonas_sp.AAC.1
MTRADHCAFTSREQAKPVWHHNHDASTGVSFHGHSKTPNEEVSVHNKGLLSATLKDVFDRQDCRSRRLGLNALG